MECLAGRIGDGDGRIVERRVIEVERARRIHRIDALRHQSAQQPSVERQKRQHHQRQRDVERRVKGRHRVALVREQDHDEAADRPDAGEHQEAASHPDQEIADREPACGGVAAWSRFDHRIERRPDVGADDERECSLGGHHPVGGEGHHQQNHRNAGVRCPGQGRRQQGIDHRVRGEGAEKQSQARLVLVGPADVDETSQRHQQEAEPDRHPPEITGARRASPEADHADENQHGRVARHIERARLDDEGRADVRAQHGG